MRACVTLLCLFFYVYIPQSLSDHTARRLLYNNPGLVTDLGVGLWAIPLPVDWDGDGDTDLLVSTADVPYKGIYLFENEGSNLFKPGKRLDTGKSNITISYIGDHFVVCEPGKAYPQFCENYYTDPVAIPFEQSFYAGRTNQWKYADFDGDEVIDLLFGASDWREYGWDDAFDSTGNWVQGPLHGYVYWAKNTGSNESPKFERPEQVLAGGIPLDVYGCPSPNLVDWDADGDLDLICGEFLDRVTYFENTGTREKPVYATGRHLQINGKTIHMELQMLQVVVYDWDRDGDPDIIIGKEDGRVLWIENMGKGSDGLPVLNPPAYFKQRAHEVKCGALVVPTSVDFDGDGDEDLVCGNTAGFLEWIENLGGSPTPKWNAPKRLTTDGNEIRIMAGMNLSIQGPAEAKWGYTVPYVADWDMDGRLDIVMNSIIGKIVWHRNTGTRTNPEFDSEKPVEVEWESTPPKPSWNWWNPLSKELVVQWRSRPIVLDINQDRLNDLVLMDHEGYLCFFERVRKNGRLVTLPGKRIFRDAQGELLQLSEGVAGRSGRRKIDILDWDGDGDFDLLINSPRTSPAEKRNIAYYENTSSNLKEFVFHYNGDITNDQFEGHTTSPTTVDWNGDGVRDLLVGAEDGFFYYYPRASNKELLGNM